MKREDIENKLDEQFFDLIDSILDWNERSVLVWDGEKFAVIHDYGNSYYRYDRNFKSPRIEIMTFNSLDTTWEDDFYSLLYILQDRGIDIDEKKLKTVIESYGNLYDYAKEVHNIDVREIERRSRKAELEASFLDEFESIVDDAYDIQKSIEAYKSKIES